MGITNWTISKDLKSLHFKL